MADPIRNVAILGATGSIGRAALEVVQSLGNPWKIWAVSANERADALWDICQQYQPARAVLASKSPPGRLGSLTSTRFSSGPEALVELAIASEVDTVVAAIVGCAGLESTLAALDAGKRVALANKEALVVGGPLLRERLPCGKQLLPVDSEHSAIFQCLAGGGNEIRTALESVEKLILTSSGGPFRTWTHEQMSSATVQQAMNHPTWDMGQKITIDSATMMNKALEVIEAHWLFDLPADKIEVVIHPQSIIHSMVEFSDGSILSQMSPPDMRLPIQFAITYPQRTHCIAPRLDRSERVELTLEPLDRERFPAIDLAFEVVRAGGTAGAVINAANEQAVELYIQGNLKFTEIVPACRMALENHQHESNPDIQCLMALDRWARTEVQRWSCSTQA